eukprot:scaffold5293_cov114-Isochrysis_galbana.AAC.3
MAPRQLRLEPIEVDMTVEKGPKRVRPDSTDESTTQVRLRAQATACTLLAAGHCLTTCQSSLALAREVSAATLRVSLHPQLLPQLRLSITTPYGLSRTIPTPEATTSAPLTNLLNSLHPCSHQVVAMNTDPFVPTAAELAGATTRDRDDKMLHTAVGWRAGDVGWSLIAL